MKTVISYTLLALGEVLIFFSLYHFGKNISQDVFILNFSVLTVIYTLLFVDLIIPWVDLNDREQKTIGSIGVRWFVTLGYGIFAILGMLYFHFQQTDFNAQLLIHCILFFFLLIGFFGAFRSTQKVSEVYQSELNNRQTLDSLRKKAFQLKTLMESNSNIDKNLVLTFSRIQEDLRFISPSNSREAWELEETFSVELDKLISSVRNIKPDQDEISSMIQNCNIIFKQRKQVLSN
jgi:hypothetical protein